MGELWIGKFSWEGTLKQLFYICRNFQALRGSIFLGLARVHITENTENKVLNQHMASYVLSVGVSLTFLYRWPNMMVLVGGGGLWEVFRTPMMRLMPLWEQKKSPQAFSVFAFLSLSFSLSLSVLFTINSHLKNRTLDYHQALDLPAHWYWTSSLHNYEK
jgi:hypothetical protein